MALLANIVMYLMSIKGHVLVNVRCVLGLFRAIELNESKILLKTRLAVVSVTLGGEIQTARLWKSTPIYYVPLDVQSAHNPADMNVCVVSPML
jgi:hypothetical protein